MDKLIRSSEGSADEEALVDLAGNEIRSFIERRWNEAEWETAWFVNPPVSEPACSTMNSAVLTLPFSDCRVSKDWLTLTSLQGRKATMRRLNGDLAKLLRPWRLASNEL